MAKTFSRFSLIIFDQANLLPNHSISNMLVAQSMDATLTADDAELENAFKEACVQVKYKNATANYLQLRTGCCYRMSSHSAMRFRSQRGVIWNLIM
jgi:hypothetical protein